MHRRMKTEFGFRNSAIFQKKTNICDTFHRLVLGENWSQIYFEIFAMLDRKTNICDDIYS